MVSIPRFNSDDIQTHNTATETGSHRVSPRPKEKPRFAIDFDIRSDDGAAAAEKTGPNISPAIEIELKRIRPKLVKRVIDELPLASLGEPTGNEDSDLQHLAQFCMRTDGNLAAIHNQLRDFMHLVQAENVYYPEPDRENVTLERQDDARAQSNPRVDTAINKARESQISQWREQRDVVVEQLSEKLFKELQIPTYGALGGPVLTANLINAPRSAEELFEAVRTGFCQKAERVVDAFLDGLLTGVKCRLYGELDALGERCQFFTYYQHHRIDSLSTEIVRIGSLTTHGTQVISRVRFEQALVFGRAYDVESMLKNPRLDIPFHYRAVLEKCPPLLHGFLFGLFGTQITEKSIAEDIETKELNWQQTWVHMDPCVAVCNTVLFGWGTSMKARFDEFQAVVDKQRKMLDAVSALRAKATTYFSCGLVVAAVVLGQAWYFAKTSPLLVAFIPSVPALACALVFLVFSIIFFGRTRLNKAAAVRVTNKRLERLEKKYRGFDPRQPRLAQPEKKNG